MEPALPIVALVGNHLRHRWLAASLASDPRLELRAVVSERHRAPRPGETEEENELIADHFRERGETEERFFGDAPPFEDLRAALLEVEPGGANSAETAAFVHRHDPRFLVLYGCGIVDDSLVGSFPARVVNLHLGLSPYYKGHATNFWPLVNGEPECVGTTIHLATAEVDAGPILRQVRPHPDARDGPHDLGCKTIEVGAEALRAGLVAYEAGLLEPVRQAPGGRIYKRDDFRAAAVAELRRRFAAGMIADYLADKPRRDAAFPIVE